MNIHMTRGRQQSVGGPTARKWQTYLGRQVRLHSKYDDIAAGHYLLVAARDKHALLGEALAELLLLGGAGIAHAQAIASHQLRREGREEKGQ